MRCSFRGGGDGRSTPATPRADRRRRLGPSAAIVHFLAAPEPDQRLALPLETGPGGGGGGAAQGGGAAGARGSTSPPGPLAARPGSGRARGAAQARAAGPAGGGARCCTDPGQAGRRHCGGGVRSGPRQARGRLREGRWRPRARTRGPRGSLPLPLPGVRPARPSLPWQGLGFKGTGTALREGTGHRERTPRPGAGRSRGRRRQWMAARSPPRQLRRCQHRGPRWPRFDCEAPGNYRWFLPVTHNSFLPPSGPLVVPRMALTSENTPLANSV